MIILFFLDFSLSLPYNYFTCTNVEILIFFLVPVNSEEGESRKRSVNIVLHC